MGCACKTNQQISYLQRKYGDKQPKSKSTNIRNIVSVSVKNILIFLLLLPIMPIIFIFLAFRHIFTKKPIDINKTFKIK
jgi:hypothetical protein